MLVSYTHTKFLWRRDETNDSQNQEQESTYTHREREKNKIKKKQQNETNYNLIVRAFTDFLLRKLKKHTVYPKKKKKKIEWKKCAQIYPSVLTIFTFFFSLFDSAYLEANKLNV